MAINAPYNFDPLSRFVYFPDWSSQVSHDVPFQDGLCGSFRVTLTAQSKFLVGDEQKDGHVTFFNVPGDGRRYAIPGSSIKGMIRNVIEIATFGKMKFADDSKYGVRDLNAPFYRNRMTKRRNDGVILPQSQAGWMARDSKSGEWYLIPCEYARVEHEELNTKSGRQLSWRRYRSALDAYKAWREAGQSLQARMQLHGRDAHLHRDRSIKIEYEKASFSDRLESPRCRQGKLVFTGNTGARSPAKHMEFFFHSEKKERTPIESHVFKAFKFIHEESAEWAFWNQQVRQSGYQERVPVFYLEGDKGIEAIGLAMMFKVAYDYSVHDLIRNTNEAHLDEASLDMAEILFGVVPASCKSDGQSLRGRVSFGTALCIGSPTPIEGLPPTILNGPKASYFPNYVKQPQAGSQSGDLKGSDYATYMADDRRNLDKAVSNPEIRGWKRYPVRTSDDLPPLSDKQRQNTRVQVNLHPLPEGTRFEFTVRFHNLRPVELGAVLWAIEWGGDRKLSHVLGMAKSTGFGRVGLELDPDSFKPVSNQRGREVGDISHYVTQFVDHMEKTYKSAGGVAKKDASWRNSEQLVQLLAMANPGAANQFPGKLCHMELDGSMGNEFVHAKRRDQRRDKVRWVLADYAAFEGLRDADLFSASNQSTNRAGADHPRSDPEPSEVQAVKSKWLSEQLARYGKAKFGGIEGLLSGEMLANQWSKIPDRNEKKEALKEIREIWQEKGWWQKPPDSSSKKARRKYSAGEKELLK